MKRHVESTVFALVGIAAVAACGSGPAGGPLPGRVSEGRAALAGTWELRDPANGRLKTRATLGADGAFSSVEYTSAGTAGETTTGTYSVAGNVLTAEGRTNNGTPFRSIGTFYVDDRNLAINNAYYPVGEHAGIVGTWVMWNEVGQLDANGLVVNGGRTSATLVFRAGGTVAVTVVSNPFSPTSRPTNIAYDATYVQSPAGTYNISPRGGFAGAMVEKVVSIGDEVLAGKIMTRASN